MLSIRPLCNGFLFLLRSLIFITIARLRIGFRPPTPRRTINPRRRIPSPQLRSPIPSIFAALKALSLSRCVVCQKEEQQNGSEVFQRNYNNTLLAYLGFHFMSVNPLTGCLLQSRFIRDSDIV
ncbi:unnamed protein product [Microthlaspi erraticum]|uniref:Uncharacterized protein n=1 Tax=Microthlaspi erraticum TaxID=1685480 RepID=A0A6D2IJ45_9BRAS|nr:unnamed protein product [Microthlaspi erraticum]